VSAAVFRGNGLIACDEVDNAQARVPQGDAVIGRDPVALAIRPAVVKALRSSLKGGRSDRGMTREECDDSAHGGSDSCGDLVVKTSFESFWSDNEV
jgi:hypothetical protein